jgi:hypothetical protein
LPLHFFYIFFTFCLIIYYINNIGIKSTPFTAVAGIFYEKSQNLGLFAVFFCGSACFGGSILQPYRTAAATWWRWGVEHRPAGGLGAAIPVFGGGRGQRFEPEQGGFGA